MSALWGSFGRCGGRRSFAVKQKEGFFLFGVDLSVAKPAKEIIIFLEEELKQGDPSFGRTAAKTFGEWKTCTTN